MSHESEAYPKSTRREGNHSEKRWNDIQSLLISLKIAKTLRVRRYGMEMNLQFSIDNLTANPVSPSYFWSVEDMDVVTQSVEATARASEYSDIEVMLSHVIDKYRYNRKHQSSQDRWQLIFPVVQTAISRRFLGTNSIVYYWRLRIRQILLTGGRPKWSPKDRQSVNKTLRVSTTASWYSLISTGTWTWYILRP